MTRARGLLFLRLACLAALGASAALLVDSLAPAPTFCGLGSGCDRIRQAGLGRIGGVPVPVIGLVAFAGLYGLSLSQHPTARRLTTIGGIVGAVAALLLIAVQAFVVGAFCVLCLTVDSAAVVAGALAVLAARGEGDGRSVVRPPGWLGLAAGAVLFPWALSLAKPGPGVPRAVMALWEPGVVNIVEFSDFECPFCRMAHPNLEEGKKAAGVPVHVVRKSFPLPKHPNARPASRAHVCASASGKGEAMAHALFTGDLAEASLVSSAEKLGLDVAAFRSCLADPATDRAVEEDIALVKSADFQGLPTVWINDVRLVGARDAGEYRQAIVDASRGPRARQGTVWPLLAVLVGALSLFALGARPSSA
jgi:predicted DsbA family dithiol-disulfide isomerase/uncharacterized membrane protein